MGIFGKTEEEIKRENELRQIRVILTAIEDYSGISYEAKEVLNRYVRRIRDGYPNDFSSLEVLTAVVIKLLCEKFYDAEQMEQALNQTIDVYHQMVDKTTPGFERDEEIVISNFIGSDGLITQGLYDEGVYAAFKDKTDYFEVMNTIRRNPLLTANFDIAKEYIKSVGKYCLTQDVFKRDIVAYLAGYETFLGDDYRQYNEEQLDLAKRRVNILSISPKELAQINSNVQRLEGLLEEFNIVLTNLQEEKQAVLELTTNAQRTVREEREQSLNSIKQSVATLKSSLKEHMDKHLADLEEELRVKSDAVFQEIIETYKQQVEEFRQLFLGYSKSTSKDLLAIQKASEASVEKLRSFVTGDEQLQKLLEKMDEETKLRRSMIELAEKSETLGEQTKSRTETPQIIVPGFEHKFLIPYGHIELPSEVSREVLPAFDRRIPAKKRIQQIEAEIKRRESAGEVFHEKVPEVIRNIIAGYWPYLYGPSGTGKGYMMDQIGSLLKLRVMDAGKIQDKSDFLGYIDPQGKYQVTPCFLSAVYGYLYFLDENDSNNPDMMIELGKIYSAARKVAKDPSKRCSWNFTGDIVVDINPNFRMASAGNTSGEGADEAYSSREKFDEASQQRNKPMFIGFDSRVEKAILRDYPEWYDFIINFRNACLEYADGNSQESAKGIITSRDAADLRDDIQDDIKPLDQIIREDFVQVKEQDYREAIARYIAHEYGISSNEEDPNYNKPLSKASGKVLAKAFVYRCNAGVK